MEGAPRPLVEPAALKRAVSHQERRKRPGTMIVSTSRAYEGPPCCLKITGIMMEEVKVETGSEEGLRVGTKDISKR